MKNKKAEIVFKASAWNKVSQASKNLTQMMLLKNPDERISVEDAIKHPWIQYHLGHVNFLQSVFNFVGLKQFIDKGEPMLTYTDRSKGHSKDVITSAELKQMKKIK